MSVLLVTFDLQKPGQATGDFMGLSKLCLGKAFWVLLCNRDERNRRVSV